MSPSSTSWGWQPDRRGRRLPRSRATPARAIEDSSCCAETGRIPDLVRRTRFRAGPDLPAQRQAAPDGGAPAPGHLRFARAARDPLPDQFRQTHQDACAEGAPITVNLTHEQIGSLVDLSRVTVTRVLNRLKRDGLLDLDGKKIMLAEGFSDSARRIRTPDGPAGSRQAGPRRFNARWCRPAGSGPAPAPLPSCAQRHAGLQAHDGALDQRRMQLVPQAGGHVDGGIAMQLVQPGLRRLDERHVHDRIG